MRITGITKNYRGITLTPITAEVYNALLFNCIQNEIKKILRKNQNGFWRNLSSILWILKSCQIIEGVQAKNLKATLLLIFFSPALDSIYRGKMEQILLAYGIPKETVSDTMMLYKNMKALVCLPDWDHNFFNSFISNILLWSPKHGCDSVGWPARIYLYQLCEDTGCSLEDLPRLMDDRDGWWVRKSGNCQHDLMKMMMMSLVYLFTYLFYLSIYLFVRV